MAFSEDVDKACYKTHHPFLLKALFQQTRNRREYLQIGKDHLKNLQVRCCVIVKD